MTSLRLSFLIRSMYDQLSSKNNLFKWKKESDPTCPLCNDKPQTLEHVLNSCKIALGNGRNTWRHNRILEELVRFIKNYMKSEPTISTQKFFLRGAVYTPALSKLSSIELYQSKPFWIKWRLGGICRPTRIA